MIGGSPGSFLIFGNRVLHNVEEIALKILCGVVNAHVTLADVFLYDIEHFFLRIGIQCWQCEAHSVALGKQLFQSTILLHLASVINNSSITHILNICQ